MEDLTDCEFGPFRVVGTLGRGGTASVYKVYQPAMDRYVALKVLSRNLTADPQFLIRFRQEAFILAQLQHPRILQVYDSGESGGYAYLAMPLVAGGTLATTLRRGQLSLGGVVRIIGQICDALDYAHSKRIIHRDIKPTNILLDERQNCLVADFGLARILENATNITFAHGVMGTPLYMSPEQVRGRNVGPPSDIYSLGIVLYELLTGRVPFIADTPAAIMMAHLTAPVPRPREFNPALPASIEDVVLKALSRAPADRFTAREFRVALVKAVREARVSTVSNLQHESLPNRPADIGSIFATIGSDAFLAEIVDNAPPNLPLPAPARSGHGRTLVAAFAVGTILSGAAFTVSYKRADTTSGPSPTVVATQPAAAAETPSAFTVSGTRSEESPTIDRAAQDIGISTVLPVAPGNGNRPLSDNTESTKPPRLDATAARVEPAVSPPARIAINAPPASQVYVDEVLRGQTGVDGELVIELSAAGARTVRISLVGKRDFTGMVETSPGHTTVLRPALIDAAASLRIRTSAGAEVFVDNVSRGVANADGVLSLPDIPSGRHDIRVLLIDKKEFRQTALLEADKEFTLDARLESLPSAGNASVNANPASEARRGRRFLLFHFVDANWHFGVLTTSAGRIVWDETKAATADYSVGPKGGLRSIAPGLHLDTFAVGCKEVRHVGRNVAVVGEHIRLSTRNYNFVPAVTNEDGKLIPKSNQAILGLQQAVEEACPGVVK